MKQSTLILSFLLVTFTTFSQTKSFGVLWGMSTFTQSNSNMTAAGGMYIDLGRFGFEYTQSAALNTSSQDALNYINGNTNSYIGGGKTDNYGVFFKIKPKNKSSIYVGGGIQKSNIIKAEDIAVKVAVVEAFAKALRSKSEEHIIDFLDKCPKGKYDYLGASLSLKDSQTYDYGAYSEKWAELQVKIDELKAEQKDIEENGKKFERGHIPLKSYKQTYSITLNK